MDLNKSEVKTYSYCFDLAGCGQRQVPMDCENVHFGDFGDSGAPQKQPEEVHDLSSLSDWFDEMTDE